MFLVIEDAESEPEECDPLVVPAAQNSMSASSSGVSLEPRQRAEMFSAAVPRKPASKYGRCPVHGVAMRPHIFKTGRNRGRCGAACPKFFLRTADQKPQCWSLKVFKDQEISTFPKNLRQMFWSLPARLNRGGVAK